MPTFSHLTVYSSSQVALVHLAADAIPLGLCLTRQEVPQLLIHLGNCHVVSLLGFLEHLLSLLNLHLAGLNINVCQDGVLGTRSLKEILKCLRPRYHSLGKHPTLLGQPFLIDDLEDCNDVCKVFPSVPMGVNRHVEVGLVRKLDLQGLRFFLGHDNVYLRHVWNGRPVSQLSLLTLSIIQPIGRIEGGTYFGMLPESSTMQEFLERRLWQKSWEPSRLNCGLKICKMQKFLGPRKNFLVPIPHVQPIGWSGTEKSGLLQNSLLDMRRI
jgi:hypothetical protein